MLPSLYEGLPVVGIEAQTSGLPCVFSDAVTAQADISGHCLFLPLSLSPQAWAQQTMAFLQGRHIDRARAWQNTCAAGYDVRSIPSVVTQLYGRLGQ